MSRKRPRTNIAEQSMAEALDQKFLYDEISSSVAPLLAQALREGWTSEKLQAHPKIQLMLTARTLSIALNEMDSSKAMAAVKDMKDRAHGKAKETISQTHKLEKLPDEQLDSLLLSRLGESDEDERSGH